MISISLEIDIPNFDKIKLEIPCPICSLHTWVTIGEIRRREFTICRGCHANIILEDNMGGFHKFVRQTTKTLKNFEV